MFAIVNYSDTLKFCDLSIVTDIEGEVLQFSSKEEAENFAEEELNGKSIVIELK